MAALEEMKRALRIEDGGAVVKHPLQQRGGKSELFGVCMTGYVYGVIEEGALLGCNQHKREEALIVEEGVTD
jgi:hypothetical protein